MINRIALFPALAAVLAAAPASAAASASEDCAVLDRLVRQAVNEFPTLKDRQLGGAWCTYRKNEFKCEWPFSTDRYGDAETQIDRLERCTAAQPRAELLGKKSHQTTFVIDSDTKVLIRGPDPNAGIWKIQLKITTTADWN